MAHSSLIIETYKKSGMGLDKGLSPTFDLLVDRYFEISDSQNPNGAMTRVREGKTARLLLPVFIKSNLKVKLYHGFRFESKLKLEYQLRESFTNAYGETDAYIISEAFRQFPVAFGLQKDSIFTQKFGELIGYVIDFINDLIFKSWFTEI